MLYEDAVDVEVNSILSGQHKDEVSLDELRQSGIPILAAFADDDDIQYMRVVSTNIDMIRTYQKRFKRAAQAGGDDVEN